MRQRESKPTPSGGSYSGLAVCEASIIARIPKINAQTRIFRKKVERAPLRTVKVNRLRRFG
jgi:hypothetical protein